MGHLKGQCSLLINFILKKEKEKEKKEIPLVILGGTLGKQRVQCMHWLLSFQEEWGFNAPPLFKPHSSFISREEKKRGGKKKEEGERTRTEN
uniref:Putative ovule protein n=1 Tax=Solanum chacoense TaxID=4108 RepID=A0A0V0HYU2_SOLCH